MRYTAQATPEHGKSRKYTQGGHHDGRTDSHREH
jgi:hypothetical protein